MMKYTTGLLLLACAVPSWGEGDELVLHCVTDRIVDLSDGIATGFGPTFDSSAKAETTITVTADYLKTFSVRSSGQYLIVKRSEREIVAQKIMNKSGEIFSSRTYTITIAGDRYYLLSSNHSGTEGGVAFGTCSEL